MWGRLIVAGLLLAGCAFDPRGSSGTGPGPDGGGFSSPGSDAGKSSSDAAVPPDGAPVEPVLLETLTIDSHSTVPVESTVVLLAGASYRLVAAGVVAIRDDGWSGDADYYWDDDTPWLVGDDIGVDIGLAVNDADGSGARSPDWGDYTDSHVYQATMPGSDSVLSAVFFDPDNSNDSGSLTLEIWGPP